MSENNFTLEELELIRNNLRWNECAVVNQELLKLNRKLEDMITDYCYHDFKNKIDHEIRLRTLEQLTKRIDTKLNTVLMLLLSWVSIPLIMKYLES